MRAAARESRDRDGQHLWWVAKPDNKTAGRFYRAIATIRDPVVAYAVTGAEFERLADTGTDTVSGGCDDD